MRTFHGFEPGVDSILVRTDYADDEAWEKTLAAATAPYGEEGFQAGFFAVDGPDWAGPRRLRSARSPRRRDGGNRRSSWSIPPAMLAPHEILVLGLRDGQGSFRCPANKVAEPQNNQAVRNLGFEECAGAVDHDGVYRGFD